MVVDYQSDFLLKQYWFMKILHHITKEQRRRRRGFRIWNFKQNPRILLEFSFFFVSLNVLFCFFFSFLFFCFFLILLFRFFLLLSVFSHTFNVTIKYMLKEKKNYDKTKKNIIRIPLYLFIFQIIFWDLKHFKKKFNVSHFLLDLSEKD